MRTLRQQAARQERERNRAHDTAMARANAPANWVSLSCEFGSHEWCMYTADACTCECHRPKAQPISREEM